MTNRVSIQGEGIGAKHMYGHLALSDRFRVTHICELNPALASEQAGLAEPAITDSIAAVPADPDVQVVDI